MEANAAQEQVSEFEARVGRYDKLYILLYIQLKRPDMILSKPVKKS